MVVVEQDESDGDSAEVAPPTESVSAIARGGRCLSLLRRFGPRIGLIVVLVGAVVGSNAFGLRDHLFGTATPRAAAPAIGRVASPTRPDAATLPAAPTSLRSYPWWQLVTTLDGSGDTTPSPFTISADAIQWRVAWSCQTGSFTVRTSNRTRPLVSGACPQGSDGYGSQTGPVALQITAGGPWHLQVAQQIDRPLVEPPDPAMTAPGATQLASGSLYNIDQVGAGKVTLFRQASGTYELRLDNVFVTPNADLVLLFSTLPTPHSSQEVQAAPSKVAVNLDVTAGSLNYTLPPDLNLLPYHSLVVWCALTDSAYAAVALSPVR